MNNLAKKIASVSLSVTTAAWLSGASMLVPVASAQTVADLQAQIAALLAQISALQSQLGTMGGGASYNFTKDLTLGSKGDDVVALQNFLESKGHLVMPQGVAKGYFGNLTKSALAKYQVAAGISPVAGYFGPKTRANVNALAAAPTTPTTPTVPTGTGLLVSLATDQPASGLFGESFASRPFTKLVLTAGSSDVTVKSLTVERTGQGQDAAFSGIIALDEDGIRMGDAKTFGSNHRAKLSQSFVVKAGQSRTITLAGDSDSDQDAYNGQLVSLSLVSVETDGATVSATYPLVGNVMTVNSTLAIGSVTITRGPTDPGTGATKEVGTTGYAFASLKLSAGSNEDVSLKSITWNQSSSAAASDLANVKVVVDGTSYVTTVSSDGKYYTAKFSPAITIAKGGNKEAAIKGDILSGSNRGVDFDLYRYADVKATGLTYGYDILPSATDSGDSATDDDGTLQASNPNFDAYEVTVGAGSITVEKATSVASQNVAINLGDQPLGGWIVTVKGEAVSVASMVFRLSRWYGSGAANSTQDITNVKLVDQSGKILAGPVDIAASAATVTFSDTVEFPVGVTTVTLKGKVGADFASGDTIAASTTPSGWTTVKGVTTGTTVTPTPSTAVTGNTMTVKPGALTVTVSPTPVVQTIVAGVQGFAFANYVLDATASGEDIRVTQMKPQVTLGQANSADDLTNCQLFDGTTALNTGTNALNPSNSVASGDDLATTFDSSVTVAKGTSKTLVLKCNTAATTTTTATTYTFAWGLENAAANVVSSGVTSGESVTETITTNAGQTITLSNSGSLAVALDASNPAVKLANANTTDNILTVLRFTATNEDVNVSQIGLVLGGASSNTPQDLSKVTLWDGGTKVGEAIFTGDNATVTLSGFTVLKNTDKTLTIKGDLAAIGTSEPGKPGHLVKVEYDGANADSAGNATRGTGVSSGVTIYATPTGSTTSSNGARVFKAAPTVAHISLPSSKLVNGSGVELYRFSVAAPSTGPAGLYKFSFKVATSTSGVPTFAITSLQVYGYSDSSFSQAAYANSGLLNSTTMGVTGAGSDIYEIYFDPSGQAGTKEAISVPTGGTRYFKLIGTVANMSATSSSATVDLEGDSAYMSGTNTSSDTADNFSGTSAGIYAFATTAANVDADNGGHDDFIWSGNSTTTSGVATYDWVNGFSVSGLPSTNLTSNILTP